MVLPYSHAFKNADGMTNSVDPDQTLQEQGSAVAQW